MYAEYKDKSSYENNEVNKFNSVVTLDFVMQLVDCSIIIPPLNWTARRP